MKWILLSSVFICSGFSSNNIKPASSQFTCTLTSDKKIYTLGEIPKLHVEIINNSKKKVLLIGSLDGSEEKFRMPWCYFIVEKPIPDTIIFQSCKTSNPLRSEDFVTVKRGEIFNPYKKVDNSGFFPDFMTTQKETFRNKGTYKIRFCYSTASKNILKYVGTPGGWTKGTDTIKLKALFKKLMHTELVSNTIELIIQ